ncbi:mechanosensitive ion channel family protein [Pleionea litopenaei]|uniref:Mechanosensitive ion channel family protein n=1 Tax=Pleionea litopenaei TaxID=3070815 RepID=A0AA51RUT0_9GAMM|nr:mechanosensitive ion channel family protein [Pleionea sp. HL-JVS1]WMS88053.1 mechanosensitive ion channel family protein [Pleionea sp. HL-JVS1]
MEFLRDYLYKLQGESAWMTEIFIIVLATLILNLIWRQFHSRLFKRIIKTRTFWDDALFTALSRPVTWAIWITGISFAIESSQSNYLIELIQFKATGATEPTYINNVILIGLFGWFLTRFVHESEQHLVEYQKQKTDKEDRVDETTIYAMSKLLRVSVIITITLVVLQTMGVSISAVLAFGGIGGIAIGFAAKDLLANFFGGLMIYLDRPFAVGDWVRSPDRQIEGTVEYIGWRQTRIRTFDKRPLYIPNSIFNNIAVENPSRMSNRRIYETIGIRYDDVAQMSSIVESVKSMLREHPEIDQTQTMIVNFNAFSASSIDFFVYTFTKTTDWIKFHEIKHEILLKIAEIIAEHSAEIAFPTSTLHVNMSEPQLSGIEQSN